MQPEYEAHGDVLGRAVMDVFTLSGQGHIKIIKPGALAFCQGSR